MHTKQCMVIITVYGTVTHSYLHPLFAAVTLLRPTTNRAVDSQSPVIFNSNVIALTFKAIFKTCGLVVDVQTASENRRFFNRRRRTFL